MAITRESIWTAADQLDAEGDRPTLAAIRKKLGGGSYSTISEAMTEWHARRTQKTVQAEPVPEKLGEAATEFAAVTWRIARELAEARLQAVRSAIEEARQQMEAEKVEAAAFADQLGKELDAAKEKVAALVDRLDTADSTVRVLLTERDQERARADRAQAVADERSRMIDTLRGELAQVRKDKDGEIARLVAAKAKPSKA
jgi:chromosome segregation ATPase